MASREDKTSDPRLPDLRTPFVLLEDRLTPFAPARLYSDPKAILRCDNPAGLDLALGQLSAGLADGLHAAGFLSYELGYALEPRLRPLLPIVRSAPLIWLGLFEAPQLIDPETLDQAFAKFGPPSPIYDFQPACDEIDHRAKVEQILALIAAGDVYQVNLTFPMRFRYGGDRLSLYGAMRVRQPVSHGGLVMLDETAVLSVSPELWIELVDGLAITRPMKGTTGRGADPASDLAAIRNLAADPKQRAENLMIVDLLRNDLARISAPGSVQVPALFTVETYPSLHTLTSTVTARPRPGVNLRDLLSALFPCGSVVGAPKVRAGEIIREIEAEPRGVYTGALGAIAPNGEMAFNVAIRTAVIGADGAGRYGVGGGIVADSDPGAEYREALLKARVLDELAGDFGLIETLRWSPERGFVRLSLHLDRLTASAAQLGFALDRIALERRLAGLAAGLAVEGGDRRVRVQLSRDGKLIVEAPALAPSPSLLAVCLAEARLDAGDPFLRHKTTRREVYDRAFEAATMRGFDECLFVNRRGDLVEASRNTLFVEIEGRLITPPLSSGALPGILRRELIEAGQAVEGRLRPEDMVKARRWLLGNSLHGLREARLAVQSETELQVDQE